MYESYLRLYLILLGCMHGIRVMLKEQCNFPLVFFSVSQAIFAADMIVVMANGLIKWFGTPKSFLATPYSRISKPDNSSPTSFAASVKDKTPMVTCELKPDAVLEDSVVCYEETKDRVEEEARKQGKVELGVYK
jgi:ATP-binding cassette, subfamily C (CFTR/MRP), member 10